MCGLVAGRNGPEHRDKSHEGLCRFPHPPEEACSSDKEEIIFGCNLLKLPFPGPP